MNDLLGWGEKEEEGGIGLRGWGRAGFIVVNEVETGADEPAEGTGSWSDRQGLACQALAPLPQHTPALLICDEAIRWRRSALAR